MNYLDGFSGYGGFHLAFERAGWKFDKCYYSEIDKHAIANYSYNFPNSIYAGSIDTICQSGIITDLDLFTFGWPCQDNSIAGKRKGQQSGTRSGLLYEAVNIIDKFKPRNFVAENVAGLLSVNKGIDIVESFKILSYLNESMPQYDIEMQLLNTRWFLPQNRERLFFIGHLRGSGSRQIFPIGDSDSEVSETRNGKDFAGCISTRNASGQCNFDGSTTLIECMGNINPSERGMNGNVFNAKGLEPTLSTNKGEGIKIFCDSGKNRQFVESGISATLRKKEPEHYIVYLDDDSRENEPDGRISGWHENENIIAAHMGDKKRSTVQEHVYHKPGGILQAMGLAHTPKVVNAGTIRRLTPIECERLQGLHDNWTRFGNYDGQVKEISDTQRYRLCGNGVSIPVVQKIAELLKPR